MPAQRCAQLATLEEIVGEYMDGGLNKQANELRWERFKGSTNIGYMKLETFDIENDSAFAADP